MKLQKLVFYAQAYKLAWLGRPIFTEHVRAWTHGPVVYELWQQHAGETVAEADDIEADGRVALDANDLEVIEAVWDGLGSLSGWELRNRTHDEDPWKDAFDPQEPRHNRIISHESMSSFYSVKP
ncbi:Panacea domain-containing protein [Brachybacterium endophyticum]|nr:type II toxin-antitoxin system antitoxin SocA domain-containing protein [Brachybacterium endophyticum]